MAVGRTPFRAIIEKSSSRSSAEVTPSGTYGAVALSLPTFTVESLAWRYGATSFAIVTASRKLSRIAFGSASPLRCTARLALSLRPGGSLAEDQEPGSAGHARNLGSNCTRLQSCRNDPLLLGPRPSPAPLHRRDHLNLRLSHSASPRITPRTSRERSAAQGGRHRTDTLKEVGCAYSAHVGSAGCFRQSRRA